MLSLPFCSLKLDIHLGIKPWKSRCERSIPSLSTEQLKFAQIQGKSTVVFQRIKSFLQMIYERQYSQVQKPPNNSLSPTTVLKKKTNTLNSKQKTLNNRTTTKSVILLQLRLWLPHSHVFSNTHNTFSSFLSNWNCSE